MEWHPNEEASVPTGHKTESKLKHIQIQTDWWGSPHQYLDKSREHDYRPPHALPVADLFIRRARRLYDVHIKQPNLQQNNPLQFKQEFAEPPFEVLLYEFVCNRSPSIHTLQFISSSRFFLGIVEMNLHGVHRSNPCRFRLRAEFVFSELLCLPSESSGVQG